MLARGNPDSSKDQLREGARGFGDSAQPASWKGKPGGTRSLEGALRPESTSGDAVWPGTRIQKDGHEAEGGGRTGSR